MGLLSSWLYDKSYGQGQGKYLGNQDYGRTGATGADFLKRQFFGPTNAQNMQNNPVLQNINLPGMPNPNQPNMGQENHVDKLRKLLKMFGG